MIKLYNRLMKKVDDMTASSNKSIARFARKVKDNEESVIETESSEYYDAEDDSKYDDSKYDDSKYDDSKYDEPIDSKRRRNSDSSTHETTDEKDASDEEHTSSEEDSDVIDDISYIKSMKHVMVGAWHQYDFLLAASRYGWDYMKEAADYMINADLQNIGTVSVSRLIGGEEIECIDEFNSCGGNILAMDSLNDEAGALGVGGMSRIIGGPMKIVWINQTNVLRAFTIIDDEDKMNRYMETVIRRNFGKPDEMKAAKPCE